MSKIALSVIVYGPFLSKTTIKTNKKQMISSADTFFLNDRLFFTGYMLYSYIFTCYILVRMIDAADPEKLII